MRYLKLFIVSIIIVAGFSSAFAQEKKFYVTDEKRLEIIVNIWGEIKQPGEYQIPDNINIVQLLSKAGGPTENANLKKVRITQLVEFENQTEAGVRKIEPNLASIDKFKKKIILVDLNELLNSETETQELPIIKPGDIIYIPKKRTFAWKDVTAVLRDLALLANAYFWYKRATD